MVRWPRDGSTWRIGTDVEVAWIADGTSTGRTITAAIPPVFDAYATVELPYGGEGQDEHDRAVLALLAEQSSGQRWWLGYLDTGADDIVFPDAPKVTLYSDWHYVLVEAGPEQAATWRQHGPRSFWKGALPNLMFPADRLAGVDAVGRRLDLHRRTSRARRQIPAPPSSAGQGCVPRPRRHTTRSPDALTRSAWTGDGFTDLRCKRRDLRRRRDGQAFGHTLGMIMLMLAGPPCGCRGCARHS